MNAGEVIRSALGLVGVLGASETPSAADAEVMLDTLNTMLDAWNTERLNIFTVQEHIRPNFSGMTCTIGPGGDIDTDRPVTLEPTCYVRMLGVDYPFKVVDGETWSAITLKTLQSSFPNIAYYDAQVPVATLYFWPQPSTAVELHVRLRQPLTQFANLYHEYDFPPGYKRAMVYSLAEEGFSVFARPLDANVARVASQSRMQLKRLNNSGAMMRQPAALAAGRGGRFNIYSGRNG